MNYYSDFPEKEMADDLLSNNINFVHESKGKNQRLDFFLPGNDVYIEIKQYHNEQLLIVCYLVHQIFFRI